MNEETQAIIRIESAKLISKQVKSKQNTRGGNGGRGGGNLTAIWVHKSTYMFKVGRI